MKKINSINNFSFIFWDFDGVILDSMSIRNKGFREVLKHDGYSENVIDKFLSYHLENGGLSRYHKFEYLFKNILKQEFSKDQIEELASNFSIVMKNMLVNKDLLIKETVSFIKNNQNNIHIIVSGSDQSELRYLCNQLGIASFFKGIYGSPTPKNKLVELLIKLEQIDISKSCLIGDSKNDYEAAKVNNISFFGFNYSGNEEIQHLLP